MPLPILSTWLLGLVSLAVLGAALGIVYAWFVGALASAAWLAGSLALALWSFTGRWVILRFRKPSPDEPRRVRGGLIDRLERLDGSGIHVELYGPVNGPPVVLTHGNGADSTIWHYQKRHLAERFRLIVWDLPGMGRSRGPATGDYRLEKLARDLDEVLALAGGRPAIVIGHSLGGMVALTHAKLYPEKVGREVAGLVLLDTAATSPIGASRYARFLRAIERPLLVPLLHLTIWLAPLVRLMTWLSFYNGSLHVQSMRTGFAGRESRGMLDFAAGFSALSSPAATARATLAMLKHDATAALPRIDVPTLVLTGDRDPQVVPEAARALAAALPSATLVTLRPGSHLAFVERHEQVSRAVAAFAAEHGAVSSGSAARRGW